MTQTTDFRGNALVIDAGVGVNDNDLVIQTGDVTRYDTFMLLSTTGAVDVFATLDGTHYSTAPLTLQDMSSSSDTPALLTAAGAIFGFRGKFQKIQVLQNGATAVTDACLICGKLS